MDVEGDPDCVMLCRTQRLSEIDGHHSHVNSLFIAFLDTEPVRHEGIRCLEFFSESCPIKTWVLVVLEVKTLAYHEGEKFVKLLEIIDQSVIFKFSPIFFLEDRRDYNFLSCELRNMEFYLKIKLKTSCIVFIVSTSIPLKSFTLSLSPSIDFFFLETVNRNAQFSQVNHCLQYFSSSSVRAQISSSLPSLSPSPFFLIALT